MTNQCGCPDCPCGAACPDTHNARASAESLSEGAFLARDGNLPIRRVSHDNEQSTVTFLSHGRFVRNA